MDMDFPAFEYLARSTKPEEGVCARFYDRSIKTDKIDAHGFPIFENVCFCEIRIRDNNSEIFDQPATEEKIKRFPVEYARYQLVKKQAQTGTPLEQFAFLSLAEVDSLKSRGIFTVEALSEMDMARAENLGISREKELADKFMQQASGNKGLVAWQETEDRYKTKIKKLEAEVRNLRAALKKGEQE